MLDNLSHAPPMPATNRTEAEQLFWDQVYAVLLERCLRSFPKKGAAYCIHLAAEHSDLALIERRRSTEAAQ